MKKLKLVRAFLPGARHAAAATLWVDEIRSVDHGPFGPFVETQFFYNGMLVGTIIAGRGLDWEVF